MLPSLFAPFLALSLAAPVEPGTTGGPNFLVQAQPVSRWIADIREYSRLLMNLTPEVNDKRFEESLKNTFGEKGFEGLDINRPFALYGTLTEDPSKTTAVVIIPITGQDEFLEFLGRLPEKMRAEPDDKTKGLYRLTSRIGPPPIPVFLRFTEQNVYLSINDAEGAVLDPAKLLPPAKVLDLADQSNLTVRAFPPHLPTKLLRQSFEQYTQMKKAFLQGKMPGGRGFGIGFMELVMISPLAFVSQNAFDSALTEAQEVALRLNVSPASDFSVELTVVPKAGTKLAASTQVYSPGPNRFAGLMPRDNPALAVQWKLPFSIPDAQDAALDLVKLLEERSKDASMDVRPVLQELFQGIARTVKAGDFEAAGGMTEPGERAFCTIQGGFAFEDTSGLEKAIRTWIASLDADHVLRKSVIFDVAKEKGVNLHAIKLGRELGDDWCAVLSENATLCIAMAPKAIYFALGPDPVPVVRSSLGAKATDAKVLSIDTNVATMQRVIQLANEPAGKRFKAMIGDENAMATILGLTATGGKDFRVRLTLNSRFLLRSFGVVAAP